MAKAYKCDICGEFFTKLRYLSVPSHGCAMHIEEVNANRSPDICPDCINAIQSLINLRQNVCKNKEA